MNQQKLPLLIIEDEVAVQAFLLAALEKHGFQIVMASSGADGLRLLQQQDFHGVVSDMRTPGGASGADVHAWIVAHRPELKNRMLFITGDTVNEETMKALQNTGVPYIEKPFRVQELIKIVERVFGPARPKQ